jgi:quercetin dioxygenase-like cupin family protein
MVRRRDVVVFAMGIIVTLATVAAYSQTAVMHSSLFTLSAIASKPTEVGSVKQVFRSPTATLDELECHVTTLNAGMASHPPHKHPNEELVIVKEGQVEVLVNGEWKAAGPGAVVFNASNELHALRNVGTGPATYHVINWKSPGR